MNDRFWHRAILTIVVILAALFAGLLIFALLPTPVLSLNPEVNETLPSQIARGRYLAAVSGCATCHTAQGGQAFAGGRQLWAYIGTIYSTNITPDRDTGIGSYSLDDFNRAVRYGTKSDGNTMYPAMPFPSYARMSDADLRALYAYLMHDVAPIRADDRASDIRWPMSLRWPLAVWRKFYAPARAVVSFDATRYPDRQIARGAYLAQTLGHCGSCHTPRAEITLQELAMDEGGPQYLAGGTKVDGKLAVNLRTIKKYPLVNHATQAMEETDRQAIAAYFATLAASNQAR